MRNLTLMTDLYQITMMNGYFVGNKHKEIATFDVFFRNNGERNLTISCGLTQVIDYIKNIKFTQEDISYLESKNIFNEKFLKALAKFKFEGNIYAVKEGTVVFPNEPLLIVEAPIWQAQLVETTILNILNHQTLIATKAFQVVNEAGDDSVLEFGLRRAQGPDAGIYGSKASYIGGCNSTSNVLAGKIFDIPISGTHSHSWVMSFDSELEAFRAYAKAYPDTCLLLVDTYDTIKSGLKNAITVFKELRSEGHEPLGIRLDSGDIASLSKRCSAILDENGFEKTKICASGDLDEYLVQSLKAQGAKIDIWGIGTKLITSEDKPSLGGVYKISSILKDGEYKPKIKISNNAIKVTNPCFKTLYRLYDANNMAIADVICMHDEVIDNSKPLTLIHPIDRWKKMDIENFTAVKLLDKVVDNGVITFEYEDVHTIKNRVKKELDTFFNEYKRLVKPHVYKVNLSDKLYETKQKLLLGN